MSTHKVATHATRPTVVAGWDAVITCPGAGLTDMVGGDIAVTHDGSWVVLGTWACKGGGGDVHVWKGFGGTGGTAVFMDTLPGEIWAVDVDIVRRFSAHFPPYLLL